MPLPIQYKIAFLQYIITINIASSQGPAYVLFHRHRPPTGVGGKPRLGILIFDSMHSESTYVQKLTAGNYYLLKELLMCGTASQGILSRFQILRHVKEGLTDTGWIKILYIIMRRS